MSAKTPYLHGGSFVFILGSGLAYLSCTHHMTSDIKFTNEI